MARNRYFVNSPRGFANEYTVFVVTNREDEARLRRLVPKLERLSRVEAEFWGWLEPKRMKVQTAHWSGGFAWLDMFEVTNLEEAMQLAPDATRAWLDSVEQAERSEQWER